MRSRSSFNAAEELKFLVFSAFFLAISSLTTIVGRERLESRLQPAALGLQALPAEAGTLNAVL